MNLQEFNYWLKGYTDAIPNPSKDQWAIIRAAIRGANEALNKQKPIKVSHNV